MTTTAPVGTTIPSTANAGFVVAGRSSGSTPLAQGKHTTATPGRLDLTTPGDAQLVNAALVELHKSPTGAPVLAALQQYGVRITVLSEAEFDQLGPAGAGAWFEPTNDVMYIRREWLQKNPAATASVIAHEGMHAVDDASGLLEGAKTQRAAQLSTLPGDVTPELVKSRVEQAMWELSIASETRAFLVQGQVLKELGQLEKARAGGAIAVAAAGSNDRATYDRVFATVVADGGDSYNPDDRAAAPFAL